MFKLFNNLAPETIAPAGGGPSTHMSKDDTIKFLTDDEDETIPINTDKADKDDKSDKDIKDKKDKEVIPIKEKTKKDDEEDDETKDEEEETTLEDELEEELEPSDEKLELVTPVRRKEILKVFPDLFKKFPYLETAYYREQKFTELLGTIDDAKEAVQKAETLDAFEADLMQGNTERMLQAMRSEAPKMFNKAVDEYLPTLAKIDKDAYLHVLGNVVKHTIQGMVAEARRSSNDKLLDAAALLNQYAFGSSEFTPPSKLYDGKQEEVNSEDTKLKRERDEFRQERFNDTKSMLDGRVNTIFQNTITSGIDPKESMTPYVRKHATREATEELTNLISNDSRFQKVVDKLWEAAIKANYSKPSITAIKEAYLSKAQTLLPSVIKKARIEALKGLGKRVVESKDDTEDTDTNSGKRRTAPPTTGGRKITNKPGEIPKGMSTLDFLNSED